jgi:hypothetical protein
MKRVYCYCGTEENHYKVSYPDTEENREFAKRDAWDGNIYFEDDGELDPAVVPSQLDIIEAQVAYTAMMTDTLLEV